jgi:hypothetical protein
VSDYYTLCHLPFQPVMLMSLKIIMFCSALKRDVTRYGTRTTMGSVDDGLNSAMRYYINNVEDVRRQQLIDTIIGIDQTFGRYIHLSSEDTSLYNIDELSTNEYARDVEEDGSSNEFSEEEEDDDDEEEEGETVNEVEVKVL